MLLSLVSGLMAQKQVGRFALHEAVFNATGKYGNPYLELEATAEVKSPDGRDHSVPLFWDGGNTWKLRISPYIKGNWSYTVKTKDRGLNGKRGSFECVDSDFKGSIEPMPGSPHHFQRQDGTPFLFWGDTAWGLYLDQKDEALNRESVFRYIDKRAGEGVNVVHSMLLSEAGWGNTGGPPFESMAAQTLNPGYWQEVDVRLKYLNSKGIIGGLALAWGDKNRGEIYSWNRFPSVKDRMRYARYIVARYSAFDVYFILSGEWHGEANNRKDMSPEQVKQEFIDIGNAMSEFDLYHRMKGIHPMTREGSVREYNVADWMTFGDYQQNYRELHERILESRPFNKPIVNSEFGYYLRDSSFNGKVDKSNSFTPQDMRYATWDILMASGYPIIGYGSTYMGGFRDPGPFNPDDPRNDVWAAQYRIAKHFLSTVEWWKLEPHDDWITSTQARLEHREVPVVTGLERIR
ncbi:MAG: DUF4038 domain-containing protein, partial [Verrucomicrobiae bacterium]|nr:DUF4038 domain-containing protein [Verrucomicrobiae bacterium]